jgi:hypothetical protein
MLRDKIPERTSIDPKVAIEEMKALLVKAMALTNISETRFANAQQWFQVKRADADKLLQRAAKS